MLDLIKKYKNAISNSAWLLLEKLILLGIEFLVVSFVARSLGDEQFGIYSFIVAFVALLSPFTVFGLSGVLVRYCIDTKGHTIASTLSSAIALRFFATFVVLIFVIVTLFYLDLGKEISIFIIGLACCEIFRSLNSVSSWFEANLKSKWTAKARVGAVSFSSLFKILGVFEGYGWSFFIIVIGFEILFHSILLVMFFFRVSGERISLNKINTRVSVELAVKGAPLLISSVGAIIYLKSDILMIKFMLGDNFAGTYSAATRISELAYVLPIIAMTSIFPIMMQHKNSKKLENFTNRALSLLFYAGLASSMFIFFYSKFIIEMLYGNMFEGSESVLVIHAFVLPIVFIRAYLSKWIILKEVYFFSLITQLSGAVTNIIGNYFLISRYGVNGAAIATLLSLFFASIIPLYFFSKTRKIANAMLLSPLYPIRKVFNV